MPILDFPSILSDSSFALMEYTAAMVGDDEKLFRELLEIAYTAKSPLCMRAARVVDCSCQRNPELIRPYLVTMVRNLPGLKDMAVKRVFMHILTRDSWVDDDEAMGTLVDTLFKWLTDDAQAISVKAYAMIILENVSKMLPDLKPELVAVIEEAMPFWDSRGLDTVGRKLLKRLRKTNRRDGQDR